VILGLLTLAFFWHGVHMSTATVDYQSAHKRLEIVIAMSADHTEEILRQKSGRQIEIDRTPDAETLTQNYILSRFILRKAPNKTMPLKWVGMEIKGGNVNCYLEAPYEGKEPVQLRNDLLLDWQRDQTNRVLAKRDGKGKPPQSLFWIGTLGEFQPLAF